LTQSRQICGAMMFPGDDAKKKIKVLSGGEQSRVLLGKVIATSCNLLLLDEPTNHLDIESIEALITETNRFEGPVVFVTHNEDFLKRVANKLIYFKDGKTTFFDGNYQDFLKKVGWGEIEKNSEQTEKPAKHVSMSKKIRPLERDIERLEERIEKLESKIAEAQKALNGDWSNDEELYAKIKGHQAKFEGYFQELTKKTEELEELKG